MDLLTKEELYAWKVWGTDLALGDNPILNSADYKKFIALCEMADKYRDYKETEHIRRLGGG